MVSRWINVANSIATKAQVDCKSGEGVLYLTDSSEDSTEKNENFLDGSLPFKFLGEKEQPEEDAKVEVRRCGFRLDNIVPKIHSLLKIKKNKELIEFFANLYNDGGACRKYWGSSDCQSNFIMMEYLANQMSRVNNENAEMLFAIIFFMLQSDSNGCSTRHVPLFTSEEAMNIENTS